MLIKRQNKITKGSSQVAIRLLSVIFSSVLVVLFFLKWDPIGVGAVATRYFQVLTYRAFAAVSDHHQLDIYSPAGQEKISVVLATDEGLNSMGHSWPPPYFFHADVLREIGRYQPKAIFLDFLFSGERSGEGIELLEKAVCDLSAAGIPVFLASDEFHSIDGGVIPKLRKCGIVVDSNLPRDESTEDGVAGFYQLTSEKKWGTSISPALAMHAVENGHWPIPERELQLWNSPMEVFWSGRRPATAAQWLHACQSTPGYAERLSGNSLCYYTPTLFIDQLFAESRSFSHKDEMLRGKLVLYGANFDGAGDVMLTPLHDRMPGIYMHAMALDNLVVYGADYKRNEGDSNALLRSTVFLLMLLLLWYMTSNNLSPNGQKVGVALLALPLFAGLIFVWSEVNSWGANAGPLLVIVIVSWLCLAWWAARQTFEQKNSLALSIVFVVLALVLSSGYSIMEFGVFNLSPQNWLEASLAAFSIGLMSYMLIVVARVHSMLETLNSWLLEKSPQWRKLVNSEVGR